MTLQLVVRSVACPFLLLAILCVTAGCVVEPLNIKDAPVKTLSGNGLTLNQVTKAIVLAGMGLKWEMDPIQPGHILGTLNLRSHQAVVDITYNTSTYNIAYKSSKHLMTRNEDGTPVGIHPNYNGWIENLDNAIRTQFIAEDK